MYTVSEFSRLCRVSAKTLRYYDSIDLLKPAKVDQENGYRYYSLDQLEHMMLINKLKEYQFPLVEILNMINKNNKDYIIENIKQKNAEILNQIEYLKQLSRKMEDDVINIEKNNRFIFMKRNLDIKVIETSEINIASIRRHIKENDMGQLFNELFQVIQENNLQICDFPLSIYHNNEGDNNDKLDIEVCVPVLNTENPYIRKLAGGLCIYTKFTGNYRDLQNVYIPLFIRKDRENYELRSAPYQKYIKGSNDTKNPEEYVTEVYLPVKKKQ